MSLQLLDIMDITELSVALLLANTTTQVVDFLKKNDEVNSELPFLNETNGEKKMRFFFRAATNSIVSVDENNKVQKF